MPGLTEKYTRMSSSGTTGILAAVMAVWMFCLCGSIHLLHTGPSLRVIDCPRKQCALTGHYQYGDNQRDNKNTRHQLYPTLETSYKHCPACDFLSKSKIEHLDCGPGIDPPIEISRNSDPVIEIFIAKSPLRLLLPRAPPTS
ncbi:MAG: hypothetical protein GF417_07555 [Candidatus Latescibacteria bacterium]|nr:hypothetical protein [bacterium]MBD3424275.1 hypothetical protein [Candidatus Latescibacterota bacterium]